MAQTQSTIAKLLELSAQRLSDFVTSERFEGLRRLAKQASVFQLTSVFVQSLILYLTQSTLQYWIVVLETGFLLSGALSLMVSLSQDTDPRQLWLSFSTIRITLVLGLVTVVVALFFASNPLGYVLLLPGPLLSMFAFLGRRVAEREVKFRTQRNAKPGEYGNLAGIVANLSPYGYTKSELSWKQVFVWAAFFEGLTISAIFRAQARSPGTSVTSPVFYTFLLAGIVIAGVIGVGLGVLATEALRRWTKAVTGEARLDTLDKSLLWFYGKNGALHYYKLFDRPFVTEMDDQSVVVAHYPASFYVRPSSSGDYDKILSVLQDVTNYGRDGRKVSDKA